MPSLDKALILRNRIVAAERAGWPDGALEKCNELSEQHERYTVWWSKGNLPRESGPGFYGTRSEGHNREIFFSQDADFLGKALEEDNKKYPEYPW